MGESGQEEINQVTLILLNSDPKCKSSDAGNSDMLQRSCKVYVCIRKNSIYRAQYYLRFQAPTGALGTYPPWITGDCCVVLKLGLWLLSFHSFTW